MLPLLTIVDKHNNRMFELPGYISLTRIAMLVADYARDAKLVCVMFDATSGVNATADDAPSDSWGTRRRKQVTSSNVSRIGQL